MPCHHASTGTGTAAASCRPDSVNTSGAPASRLLHFAPGAPREAYFEGLQRLAGMTGDEKAGSCANTTTSGSERPLWMPGRRCCNGRVEPLTAIAVIVGRYGVTELVGALSGRADVGGLAGEIFGALSATESRLSTRLAGIEARLTGIERRLDQVLAQRYETALGTGLRGLLDAGGTRDARLRTEDLGQARDRFREASAAARTPLQAAVAERYLVLCALAMGRADAARTAWAQLGAALVGAAVGAVRDADAARTTAAGLLDARGVARGRHYADTLAGEETLVRDAAVEAADLVVNLFAESAALGRALGEPDGPPVRRGSGPSAEDVFRIRVRAVEFRVAHAGAGPVRIGALTVTWERFDLGPEHSAAPAAAGAAAIQPRWAAGLPALGAGRRDAAVTVRVDADPVLGFPVAVELPPAVPTGPGHLFVRRAAAAARAPTVTLAAGARTVRATGTLSLPTIGGQTFRADARVVLADAITVARDPRR